LADGIKYVRSKCVKGRGKIGWTRFYYIHGLTLYAALTGKSPVGLPAPEPRLGDDGKPMDPTFTKEDVLYMQTMTWKSQQKYSKMLEMPEEEVKAQSPKLKAKAGTKMQSKERR
jgi:hypothetical protein